jgi:glycerophosphoryl diester phosphodiesterase
VFGSQAAYAQSMIDEFKRARVDPRDVYAQSFNLADVIYWVTREPAYGRQAVYLDDVDPGAGIPPLAAAELRDLRRQGVRIFAPPIPALLAVDSNDQVVPSRYAKDIKAAGLKIISWSFERADLRKGAKGAGFYAAFDPDGRAIRKDSDMFLELDALAQDVGVIGLFSDWPATVSYYASCMGLD